MSKQAMAVCEANVSSVKAMIVIIEDVKSLKQMTTACHL